MAAIRKILIANRGEIAVRVLRTAREMGIATVAVYSEADREARHVTLADEAYLLGPAAPAQSYLHVARILEIAARSGADAVHPGYGFLSENAEFAQAVVDAGLIWIGPNPAAIHAMGDKVRARQAMLTAGVPVVPGGTEPLETLDDARRAATAHGLPLALKASGGGGGKGLKVVRSLDELEAAFSTARREAQAYFKNPTIYAERYLDNPKHIELQVLADRHGTVLHVGERDCSLQRRHQKLLEEALPALAPSVREALRAKGLAAARAVNYDSVGTIEFLVSGNHFYFLEMNTRIQVEHTVSEMVTGLDLIREQIRAAAGEPLGYAQSDIAFHGHAIEIRVNAEDPTHGFAPAPGLLAAYEAPAGPGVRVDSAAYAGLTIPPDYDSLIAKLIVWAPTRDQTLARLRRAIDEFVVGGVPTTLPFLRALIDHPPVIDASHGTATLEAFAATRPAASITNQTPAPEPPHRTSEQETIRVEVNDRLFVVRLLDRPRGAAASLPVSAPVRPRPRPARAEKSSTDEIAAPIHGLIVELDATAGAEIRAGQVVAVLEAMKMMNEIRAHRDGIVATVHVTAGQTVEPHAPLITLCPTP